MAKPHGLRGQVVVELTTNRTERLAPGARFGTLVVTEVKPHGKRWIVGFEGITDRDGAESLRDVILEAEPIEDPDALWVHELIGADVLDTNGTWLGVVSAVEANPASDLLVLDGGGLVPLRFVVDHDQGKVVVDPPEGLLDL